MYADTRSACIYLYTYACVRVHTHVHIHADVRTPVAAFVCRQQVLLCCVSAGIFHFEAIYDPRQVVEHDPQRRSDISNELNVQNVCFPIELNLRMVIASPSSFLILQFSS